MSNSSVTSTNSLFQIVDAIAPALATYTLNNVVGELWSRPGLATRDRALVTISILVARNASSSFPHYFNKALDSGLEPFELSELLTHLAFYAGWPYALDAVVALRPIFDDRGVLPSELREERPSLVPAEDSADLIGPTAMASPALQHFTDGLLLNEVWQRPGLNARDRTLATIAVMAAQGQTALIPSQVQHAKRLGVATNELDELLAHVAFYAGWGYALQVVEPLTAIASTISQHD